jgi:methylthioribose-1-phosphate isomerase
MFSSDDLSSLRWDAVSGAVEIIDQTLLPHTLHWVHLDSLEAYCRAISVMQVRGAPLIGITAAFGLAHAVAENPSDTNLVAASASLMATRPTAVNLRWALETMERHLCSLAEGTVQLLPASRLSLCARLISITVP